MHILKHVNNSSGLQLFQLIRFGSLLLISIIFAKSTLTTESIGDYETFLFIAALASSFWINGLIQSFLPLFKNNHTFQNNGEKSPEIFNVFILISGLGLLTVLLLTAFRAPLTSVLSETGEIPYFNLILTYILLSSPAYLIEYLYLLKNQAGRMLIYGIASYFLQVVFIAFPALTGKGMEWCLSGLILISAIRLIWLIAMLRKHALPQLSVRFMREHLHLAYPLIVSTLLGSSAQYVDGFLVLNHFDSETFAIFRYGAREFPLVLLMANALSTAMIQEFSGKKNISEALDELKLRSTRLMHLLFPVTIVFLLSSKWLYPLVFNAGFAGSAVIFNIYLLLIISRLVFPQTILIGLRRARIIMYASIAELLLNIILSVIFIRCWGLEGIAFATFIAYAVQKMLWILYNKYALAISPRRYIPVRFLIIYSVITLFAFWVMYTLPI